MKRSMQSEGNVYYGQGTNGAKSTELFLRLPNISLPPFSFCNVDKL